MKKKILITGGNGFIGTNLIIELLKDKNNKIVKSDLLNFYKIKNIIFTFKPDLVLHLAAETHVDVSLTNPLSYYDNNIKTTLNLLSILNFALNKKLLSRNFKFVHIGTDEIYGDVCFNSKKTFDENQPLNPNNPYSASKAAGVLIVKTWHKNFNFPCIISNSVNNFGPFQFVEKFIPRSILLSSNNKNIEI